MFFWCHFFDQNSNKKYCKDFCPYFFWFLGASGDLVSDTINNKPTGNPKKLPWSPKEALKLSGHKSLLFAILVEPMTPKSNFKINCLCLKYKILADRLSYYYYLCMECTKRIKSKIGSTTQLDAIEISKIKRV